MVKKRIKKMLLGKALDKYFSTVSRHKRGQLQEFYRINVIKRSPLVERYMDDISSVDIAEYRDSRLSQVSPERKFAEFLDHREDIRLFMKLPPRFQIDTPVGPYNPDWAIIKSEEGGDRIYMVRETKSTMDEQKRRPSENAKIKSAEAHFREIGIEYAVSVPEQWNI